MCQFRARFSRAVEAMEAAQSLSYSEIPQKNCMHVALDIRAENQLNCHLLVAVHSPAEEALVSR